METPPKERVIYDESAYSYDSYYDEGNESGLWGEWANDVFVYADDAAHQDVTSQDWQDYLSSVIQTDYEAEIAQLSAFFAGEKGDMSSFQNPLGGNTIIAVGSIGRWDGMRQGFTSFENFEDAIDTSPSRFGLGNVFADCEIQKIWDENGHLYVHGAHHDGSVTVELRQLTGAGMMALETMEESGGWGEPFTIVGTHETDWAFLTYDGSEQSVAKFFRDLLSEPSFAPLPRFMEQCFGCPAEEYVQAEPQQESLSVVSLAGEVSAARAASVELSESYDSDLGIPEKDCEIPEHR